MTSLLLSFARYHRARAGKTFQMLLAFSPLLLTTISPALAQISFAPIASQPPDNIYGLTKDPITGTFYACNGTRVLASTNEGATWTAMTNNGSANVKCVYVSAAGQLYIGAEKSVTAGVTAGVFKYNVATNTWAPMPGSPLNVTALLEDALTGTLYAGTGLTGNVAPHPINYGTGVWAYSGGPWSAANTGIGSLPGYPELPYIKGLAQLSTGEPLAATYGGGVLKYTAGAWTSYGIGLPNLNANCLAFNSTGALCVGTDTGVYGSTGAAWATVQPGLPAGKPVRALLLKGTTLYAGLGFYHYQKGSFTGDIYSAGLGASAWANVSTGINSSSVMGLTATSTGLLAGASGVWSNSSGSWALSMGGFSLPNRPYRLRQNAQGHLFAMCGAVPGSFGMATTFGYSGMYRSTDGGGTWTAINQGLKCQGLTAFFIDSQGSLWVAGHQFVGGTSAVSWANPELYKSTDNGTTWVQNTSIASCHTGYEYMAEAPGGRLYVAHSFFAAGSPSTNVSATNDFNTFDNTLTGNAATGYGKVYGMDVNANGDVFVGTESGGILRSTANGAAGSFSSMTIPAPNAPAGNNSVYVDPYTGTIFGAGSHGKLNNVGNQPKDNFCSLPADNGVNMFPFNNLPDYTTLGPVICDNRGNFYGNLNASTFTVAGLYVAQAPFTSNTVFTRLTLGPASLVSYQFNSFLADACGYLYGTNAGGAGIYRSNVPVNTPVASTLTAPADVATNVPPAATLTWSSGCAANTYRLQVATDAAFGAVVYDNAAVATNAATLPAGTLAVGTAYFWRVRAQNAAGNSPWSAARTFVTSAPLPVTLLSFDAVADRRAHLVQLRWQTASELDNAYFSVEKSPDGKAFQTLQTIPAAGSADAPHRYCTTDETLTSGLTYYRLRQVNRSGTETFSPVVAVTTPLGADCLTVFDNEPDESFTISTLCAHSALQARVLTGLGATVASFDIPAAASFATGSTRLLSSGLYLVQLRDANGTVVGQFKKMKCR